MNDTPLQENKLTKYAARLGLMLGGFILAFLLLELATRGLIHLKVVPDYRTTEAMAANDPVLGYALKPHQYADVDAAGFRNPAVPQSADIVTLGDSQTYGYNALSRDSWPKQLGDMTSSTVYNMGMGGYGPAQYFYLMDKALALHPKLVVIGFYMGNDIDDACNIFSLGYWKDFARQNGLDVSACANSSLAPDSLAAARGFLGRLRDSARNSAFLMLLKQVPAVSDFVSQRRDLRTAQADPAAYYIVNDPEIKTILPVGASDVKIGFELPNIERGAELTKYFYGEIIKKAQAAHTKLLIVFIPDKPDVLYDYLASKNPSLPDNYSRQVAYERSATQMFREYFKSLNIPTVDARIAMASKIGSTHPPLFLNYIDRHPTKVGYAAIAQAAADGIKQLSP